MNHIKASFSVLLIAAIAVSVAGCATIQSGETVAQTSDLMSDISPNTINGRMPDADFTESMADFSIKLFKQGMSDRENSLISPLSVTLALAMTANGADGNTFTQMEKLLGGDIPLSKLNEYLKKYASILPNEDNSKLHIANSVWFRDHEDRLLVETDFLQKCADYYNAALFKSKFNARTVRDINDWAKTNTAGMIDKIIDKIKDEDMLYLVNAITFDAEWENMYWESDVSEGNFTDINGKTKRVYFMRSSEYTYINDDMATGFIKPYATGYSFVALLPNENISLQAYIESLTGDGFLDLIERSIEFNEDHFIKIETFMPKFEYEYKITLNDTLKALGMTDAFERGIADFRKMGISQEGRLFISEVLHKTYISVDERGTRAGAATTANLEFFSGPTATVRLDRPFVYAIIDNSTYLPIFFGTLMTV